MKLVVISHKACWSDPSSASGHATDGGFPRQMRAIASRFDETCLVVACTRTEQAAGGSPLEGPGLRVAPLRPVVGTGLRRKLGFPLWLLRNLPHLVRSIRRADAVHAVIPGDVGLIGLWLAVLLRKPVFVRHCGNWRQTRTRMDGFAKWSMRRLATPARPMFATGADPEAPAPEVPDIHWIFSTSLTERELAERHTVRTAPQRTPCRLITVSRQEPAKGTAHILRALPGLRDGGIDAQVHVVGDGSARAALETQAATLGVAKSVVFHGQVAPEAVLGRLQDADLFLLLSASEGFPKVVVEALACGLPVVATRVSALPSLLESGAGVLVDATDPITVEAAIRKCLVSDAAYAQMSACAVAQVAAYSLEAWAAALAAPLTRAWGRLGAHAD